MDIQFNTNEDYNKLALSELRKRLKKVKEGGGKKNLEKFEQLKFLLILSSLFQF